MNYLECYMVSKDDLLETLVANVNLYTLVADNEASGKKKQPEKVKEDTPQLLSKLKGGMLLMGLSDVETVKSLPVESDSKMKRGRKQAKQATAKKPQEPHKEQNDGWFILPPFMHWSIHDY